MSTTVLIFAWGVGRGYVSVPGPALSGHICIQCFLGPVITNISGGVVHLH